MRQNRNLFFFLLIPLIISACGQGTSKGTSSDNTKNKPILSTTVLPVATIIEKIAGDDFQVNAMVPDGMPPVAYEPTSSQLKSLENSTIYFSLEALGFELYVLPKIIGDNPNLQVINLSKGIETIMDGHDHGHDHGIDPHMWMSPKQTIQIAKNVYVALLKRYPEKKESFNLNFQSLMIEIRMVDDYLLNSINHTTSQKTFMIYHPALTYLARDYGLEQIPIELHGKEPSPDYLQSVIDHANEKKVGLIFIQRQFDSNFARIVAKETQSKVVVFDPLSTNWEGTIRQVADAIKN